MILSSHTYIHRLFGHIINVYVSPLTTYVVGRSRKRKRGEEGDGQEEKEDDDGDRDDDVNKRTSLLTFIHSPYSSLSLM